eukprot:TRINITY_DN25227_c0_g1_i1.p1 TRINITY_DN25227_c0_g1~~TRINITY_DN25227_c0_g1_i1.p1  ORF type:complete len:335 (-),score=56.32 TRINITY_DN25227_c0_g1_i1:85-1089(-)
MLSRISRRVCHPQYLKLGPSAQERNAVNIVTCLNKRLGNLTIERYRFSGAPMTKMSRPGDIDASAWISALESSMLTGAVDRAPAARAVAGLVADNPTASVRPDLDEREAMRCILTQNVVRLSDDTERAVNVVLAAEARPPLELEPAALPTLGDPRLFLWRADITRLRVDAIVNAANSGGLGCFVYGHRCVDNVIHDCAGPRVRLECQEVLAGRRLETGAVIVTSAGVLPSRHVMHTVGPIWPKTTPDEADRDLARCYTACLDECVSRDLHSIAFPCISTGIFGFPQRRAADLVLRTLRGWLAARPTLDMRVVLCVFTDVDEQLYASFADSARTP